MKVHKIGFFKALPLIAFGALLGAIPAAATPISFTTSTTSTGSYFTFTGANVPTFDPGGTFETFTGTTTSTSFGGLSIGSSIPTTAVGSVIDVDVHPTVSGNTTAVLDFKGTVTSQVVSNTTEYFLTFNPNSTTGQVAGTGIFTGYTDIVQNGVTYAVQTQQQLNVNKTIFLVGGVYTAPEPATLATTGLALALVGLMVRRRAKLNS